MPKFENYFVVEFRYPVIVEDVSTVAEAVSKANRICERVHGFKPKNWFARIFEYSTKHQSPGLSKEYFYNPNSSTYREIKKNIDLFNDLNDQNLSVEDIFDYEVFISKVSIDEEVKIKRDGQ
jgi:hypothetical protein